jgi:hypothetical protein
VRIAASKVNSEIRGRRAEAADDASERDVRDQWYSDSRDLVKWSTLLLLASRAKADRIIQIALYNESEYGKIELDGQHHGMPKEVLAHFRDIRSVVRLTERPSISVYDRPFSDRQEYFRDAVKFVASFSHERCVVFLDPDTGLEPPKTKADRKHVLEEEARALWLALPVGWVFVFYQHKTTRDSKPWIEPKRDQFANALGIEIAEVGVASGFEVAGDVVLLYATKV